LYSAVVLTPPCQPSTSGASGADNGNVFGIINYKDNSRSQIFAYDPLNRLASAQNLGTDCSQTVLGGDKKFWGNTYTYDAWGNLFQKTKIQTACSGENLAVIVDETNQLLNGYGYDAAGNMTLSATPPTQNYIYDQENRITGADGYTYTYDADGNRVKKSNGTGASAGTLYWYMTPGIVAESDQAGTLKSEYVFFDGERVARRDLVTPTGVFYYFSDHLKTASVITDSVGNIKAESDYYRWGGELQFVANNSNHYKFTGKERDSESGLDYFGARYYSNGLGRFISADWSATPVPVPYADFGDPQSLNLYTYVRNIPTVRVDADGHCCDNPFDSNPFYVAWHSDSSAGHAESKTDFAIGAGKELVNMVTSTINMMSDMHNGVMVPGSGVNIPQLQMSNPMQVAGAVTAAVVTVAAPLGPEEGAAAQQLQGAANRAAEVVGPGSGAVHGTEVHTEFASEVKALGNSNLSTEVSYKNGAEVARGTKGSIRVDVVEGPKSAPRAVHDLKTGNARLTPARTQQIQKHVPGGSKVPVKEIKPQ
jgi:RHS repeat-associated protein